MEGSDPSSVEVHGCKFHKNSITLFGFLDIVDLYLKPVF